MRLDPAACAVAPAMPSFPAKASLPQPVTQPERAGLAAYLDWVGDLVDWGQSLARTAAKTAASPACRA